MRKIEENMLNAVKARRNWQGDNTSVSVMPADGRNRLTMFVYLYGNLIASTDAQGVVKPYPPTVRRWPTVTTLSRLRALGVDVRKHKGQVLVDGEPI